MSIAFRIIALGVLVAINGFFVAAEFALVKIRDTQLETLVRTGNRRARVARRILGNLDASLSACQLGVTLASLGLGWIGEPIFTELLSPVMTFLKIQSPEMQHTLSFVFGFSLLTFLHITAGEQAPKWLAIQRPLPTSLWIAFPLRLFYKASYPFIWMLNHTSLWMLRKVGIEPASEHELTHSEEELRVMFSTTVKERGGTALGRDIVLNALDLKRRIVREVMRPRREIVNLSTESSIAECLNVAEKSRYSRFPLCEGGDLDRTVGVVHIKDLYALRLKVRNGSELAPAARKLIYVPETSRLEKLLQLFLERKSHLAIVVDEYGSTVGMITLENILEEVVGQIQDEFDQEKALQIKTSEDSWEIDGALPLHELESIVGQSLAIEGVNTASGWITSRSGGFPKQGDTLTLDHFQLSVEETDGPRVSKAIVKRRNQVASDTEHIVKRPDERTAKL